MRHPTRETLRYRIAIGFRIAAAAIGGYGVTALIVMLASQLLRLAGVDPAQAVLAATIPAFLCYAAIVCAIFHVRTATRGWAMLVIAATPLASLVALLGRLMP